MNVEFGREYLSRLPSSIVEPYDLSQFVIDEEEVYLCLDMHEPDVIVVRPNRREDIDPNEYRFIEDPRISSDTTVVFISINDAYYTLFHDFVPLVYKLFKTDPSLFFLIHNQNHGGYGPEEAGIKKSRDVMTKYVDKFLTDLGVNHIFHQSWEDPIAVKVHKRLKLSKNQQQLVFSLGDVAVSMKKIREHVLSSEELSAKPYRKVYLSRTHLKNDRPWDRRIRDEEVLEDYFRNKGYDILIPEKKFSNFEEQIRYFNEVRVLAGLTGTGLANGFLMQERQYIIDLSAELTFDKNDETKKHDALLMMQNEHYVWNSYINNQYHITVPTRQDPYDVCSKLDEISSIIDL